MIEVTVNKFRAKLKESVERVISNHEPMWVSRRNGGDFIVVSADDWLQEQETLYVLQNSSLMEQIVLSSETYKKGYLIRQRCKTPKPRVKRSTTLGKI